MAKYYTFPFSSFAVDFAAALTDYYGNGATIDSASGQTITFSCPQICDKPLTISHVRPISSIPTQHLTGVCDGVTFQTGSGWAGASVISKYHLILADSFLLLQLVDSGDKSMSSAILIAKITNGRFLCMGGESGASNSGICKFTDEAENRPIWFMVPYQKRLQSGKKIPIFKSHFAINGEMELNPDGSFAYIEGLYLTGEITTGGIVGHNYFLSHDIIRGNSTNGIYMPNAFFVELEV